MARSEYDRNVRVSPTLQCAGGARACPPEDCGGLHGCARMLEFLSDPNHEEYADMRRWVGRSHDPEKFNGTTVNKKTFARKLERQQNRQ